MNFDLYKFFCTFVILGIYFWGNTIRDFDFLKSDFGFIFICKGFSCLKSLIYKAKRNILKWKSLSRLSMNIFLFEENSQFRYKDAFVLNIESLFDRCSFFVELRKKIRGASLFWLVYLNCLWFLSDCVAIYQIIAL